MPLLAIFAPKRAAERRQQRQDARTARVQARQAGRSERTAMRQGARTERTAMTGQLPGAQWADLGQGALAVASGFLGGGGGHTQGPVQPAVYHPPAPAAPAPAEPDYTVPVVAGVGVLALVGLAYAMGR